MLGHEAGEEGAVDPAGDVVPRRDRKEGAGIVVEADGIEKAGSLGGHLAEAPHPFRAVVEPPGRAELQARIMAGQRRELAGVDALVQREQDDREARLVAEAIEQRLQRMDVICARNSSASCVLQLPPTIRANSASFSPRGRSAVSAVGWP